MTSDLQANAMSYIVSAVLGVVAVVIVAAALSGRELPLVANERQAMVALALIGIVMCTLAGIGPTQSAYGWGHPITLIGAALGVLALLVAGLTLIGANTGSAIIGTDRAAMIALAVIMVAKVAIVALQRFITP